ncbi:thyroid receptor-interacting protein 11 [Galendromus occidentalis]|uniref:Thyroid receptor-interacting protein 11 n=1 Tax=Galendromus occidentalis TaxID=34638 RepID=A0AAJ6QX44_9ACAR|nr:thyroid receptor-interacting protein 11 [Galendromus occidentalis]
MSTSVRLENEQLGSHHFDAIRERDEAQALEEVRLKERELEQEAVHAFDDLLDASGSEASSYYKPPNSQQENGNVPEEIYLQSQKELEKLRNEYDRLRAENGALRTNFDSMVREKLKLEEKLEKSEVRMNLLEQEIGELSDAQTVHRVKDQYETIIEKLKSSFHHEKGEILVQLNKFKEEALLARNHICSTSEAGDDRRRALESEVERLRINVGELQEKELQLQLMVKEQSMLLKENDLPEEFDGNLARLCDLLDIGEKASSLNCAVTECCDAVVELKHRIKELDSDVATSTRLFQELQIAARVLEKENLQLKEKLEHNSSDTESHSETTRVGTLKGALEKLEAENLHLKLQVQTLEESRDRLKTEIRNRINEDSKNSADFNELYSEKQRLLVDLQRAQEFSSGCRRAQEMAEEVLREKIEAFEAERENLRREIEAEANRKLQNEINRMELQFANEVSQRGEMGDKLRKACLMMLEERLAKICREKDAEIGRLTRKSQEEAEMMHERCELIILVLIVSTRRTFCSKFEIRSREISRADSDSISGVAFALRSRIHVAEIHFGRSS